MLTGDKIIQGLECCIFDECENCPHDEETACAENLQQEAINFIKSLQTENKQLQSDVITANHNLEHFKELWEADKAKAKETISKYIDKHNELILREKEIGDEAVTRFAEKLEVKARSFVIDSEGDFITSEIDGEFKFHSTFEDALKYLSKSIVKEWVGENND